MAIFGYKKAQVSHLLPHKITSSLLYEFPLFSPSSSSLCVKPSFLLFFDQYSPSLSASTDHHLPSLHLARSLLKAEVLVFKVDRASLLPLGFTLVSRHHPCLSPDRSSSSSSHLLFFAVSNVLLPCLRFLAVVASPVTSFLSLCHCLPSVAAS